MYTGIVQGMFPIVSLAKKPGLLSIGVELTHALLDGLTIGASVGVDGVCLTVTGINNEVVSFDIIQETLTLTTLSMLEVGSLVNVERSAKQGAEIGGHNISGHVDASAEIVSIETPENNQQVTYRCPTHLKPYIFHKGFVGLNGCSLTVSALNKSESTFSVSLIPETLRVTNHGLKKPGDRVNVEVDRQTQVIVDTVRAFLAENASTLRDA